MVQCHGYLLVSMCLDNGTFNQQREDKRLGRERSTVREGRREEDRKDGGERGRREEGIDIDQLSKYLMFWRPVFYKSYFFLLNSITTSRVPETILSLYLFYYPPQFFHIVNAQLILASLEIMRGYVHLV